MAAVLGLAEAQFTLADKLVYKYNNYSEGVLWCMRSAENNCADAQKMMGDIFRSGRHGVNRDMERAFNYYKKAAEGGNTKSCLILAKMYRNGEYVEQNYQEALRYYTRVVMEPDDKKYGSNHWTANQDLAELYLLGLGTTENGAKAAEYCMNNALQGDSGSA